MKDSLWFLHLIWVRSQQGGQNVWLLRTSWITRVILYWKKRVREDMISLQMHRRPVHAKSSMLSLEKNRMRSCELNCKVCVQKLKQVSTRPVRSRALCCLLQHTVLASWAWKGMKDTVEPTLALNQHLEDLGSWKSVRTGKLMWFCDFGRAAKLTGGLCPGGFQ